jgi:site-specific DNA-methyltransferase (adenine-specific)
MEIDLNKKLNLIQGDCLEVLKQLPDDSVDVVIIDPPYGDNSSYGRMQKKILNNENPLLNCQVLPLLYEKLKDNTTLYNFTNWKHYPFLVNFIQNYTKFKINHLLVWEKGNIGMGYSFRNKFELILVLEKGKGIFNKRDFADVIKTDVILHNDETHPHTKPNQILTKLIEHSSNINDLVLDCFAGSGSTGVASLKLNRRFIGIELDKAYFDLANKNCTAQAEQERLW